MKYQFSRQSIERLKEVHPVLVAICWRALSLSEYDFGISQGKRTRAEQARMVEQGKSQTMDSKHLTGHAIDFAVYDPELTWDFDKYREVAHAFYTAAAEYDVTIRWGGDWDSDGYSHDHSLVDGPHIEINPSEWP